MNQLCGNLTQILSAFKLITRLVSIKFKRHLYYAYCFSRIAYGIGVYGAPSNTCIHKLQVMQNRIVKTLYNNDWYTCTSILHKNLNILKIKDLFSLFQLVFVHNQQLGKLPDNFSDYFITRDDMLEMKASSSLATTTIWMTDTFIICHLEVNTLVL